jgi:hypothetical protein
MTAQTDPSNLIQVAQDLEKLDAKDDDEDEEELCWRFFWPVEEDNFFRVCGRTYSTKKLFM